MAMPGSADTLRARVKRVEIIEYEKRAPLSAPFFLLRESVLLADSC